MPISDPFTDPSVYLIDRMLKRNLVNMVYGASGSNKTTWVLQLLNSLATEQKFLGEYSVNSPLPKAHYISFDRPAEELTRKIKNVFPSLVGRMTTESCFPRLSSNPTLEALLSHIPFPTKLLVLDSIGFVVDGKKLIDQRAIGSFMSQCYNWAQAHQATLILIHHNAKSKTGSGYANAREKASGSGAWAACSGLAVSIGPISNETEDARRQADIMDNDQPGLTLHLEVTNQGLVIASPPSRPSRNDDDDDPRDYQHYWDHLVTATSTAKSLIEQGVPKSTAYRIMKQLGN